MKRNEKEYQKANVEYMELIDFAKLLRKRGFGDLFMNFTDPQLDKNSNIKTNEEVRFSPINGVKRFATNIVSKIKGEENIKDNSQEINER